MPASRRASTTTVNWEHIRKIGLTGGDVQRRIANAKLDATFLLADVDVVTTYVLYHVNRTKPENLLHRFFRRGDRPSP